ncbi:MAG: iron-siderophore transport system permease protein [Solirubrobacteraceae bacterium]|nr:iron-siderophore transport system permease protein [Solirubrobacteraceae bacterium]
MNSAAARRPGLVRRRLPRGVARTRSPRAMGFGVALGGLLLAVAASLAIGSNMLPPATVVDALTGQPVSAQEHAIVMELRGPRTIIGVLAGMAFGLSGALLQGLTRNPLADPSILGISTGASFAAAVAVYAFGVTTIYASIWFAFAGAALGGGLAYAVGGVGRDGASPLKLALAGAAVTALFSSLISFILTVDLRTLDVMRFWLVGSLAGRGGGVAAQVWPFVAVGVAAALACGRLLNAMALGEDVARSQGLRLGQARAFVGVTAVLLAGAATAAAGPIVFVGLTVPHIARAIVGPDYRWILLYCLALSPTLLLAADVLGRVVGSPGEIQVGVVTAVVGAPLFVVLVRRRRLAEL